MNECFLYELKKLISCPEVEELGKITLTEAWHEQTTIQDDQKQILEQIRKVEKRLSNARDLVATKQIDAVDFREMKSDYNTRLEKLQAKLSACNNEQMDFSGLLDTGLKSLFRLDYVYENGTTEKKREVISSMYPEKLTFDGYNVRTTRVN